MNERDRERRSSSARFANGGAAVERLQFRRAQMSLGTLVSISIGGLPEPDCVEAARNGFAAVRTIHELMSFHECGSDVDRLNCQALKRNVEVDPLTMRVLKCALEISAASRGTFDITVAGALVAHGLLPRPPTSIDPSPDASWRDIELSDRYVRFHRPLWIDLGGIAKGFAVDYAFECMDLGTEIDACVDAGGDLRLQGQDDHPVRLRAAIEGGRIPVLFVPGPISIASSAADADNPTNIQGVERTTMGERTFVTVISSRCMLADALTKVAMAGSGADDVLRAFASTALINTGGKFSTLGALA